MPKGSRVLPNKESVDFATGGMKSPLAIKQNANTTPQPSGNGDNVTHINIAKLADSIVVREEADIDKIGKKVADEIRKANLNKKK